MSKWWDTPKNPPRVPIQKLQQKNAERERGESREWRLAAFHGEVLEEASEENQTHRKFKTKWMISDDIW